jgi:UDP-N-acetylglucosamine 2-epimerase (non-hydrolysing)
MRAETLLVAIVGTRPEAIKMAPVVQSLRARHHSVMLLLTGQHPDLAPALLKEAGLVADLDLGAHAAGAGPAQLLAAILTALPPVLQAQRPAALIVQGDTVSALAGALAGAYLRVPVAHVEAGLRTGNSDEPFPEEIHRSLITRLAGLHLAPTETAAAALEREGIAPASIHVTGNSGIDAVLATAARLDADADLEAAVAARFPFVATAKRPLVLVTVHRRENIGRRLQSIAAALARLAAFFEADIVLPLHPNPDVHRVLRARLDGMRGVHLLPPVDHAAMVWLMRRCQLLLTDSGGLQEEAPAFGLRLLVLRTATERPESVALGAAELVDLKADSIVAATRRALAKPPLQPIFPYGQGDAAMRIASAIEAWLRVPRFATAAAVARYG